MATSTLEFLILAKDQASEVFSKVGDSVEKSSNKMDKMKAVSGVALAAVGAGMVAFGKSSVDAFEDAQAKQAKLEDAYSRFPAMADVNIESLRKLNSEVQRKTGFDDDDLAASEASLAAFGLTGDQIAKLTPLVADYATKAGTDLATATDQVGKSMLGQGRALKTLGINFTDTKSVAGNFAEVSAGLTDKVGGLADKMGDTAAGKSKILSTEFENLKETAGGALSPALEKVTGIGTKLIEWLTNTPGALMAVGVGVGLLAAAWGIYTIAQWAANSAVLANPITWIVVAAVAAIAGIILAIKNWGAISTWLKDVWGDIAGWFTGVWNSIKHGFGAVGDWITDKWNGLIDWFKAMPGRVGDALAGIWDGLTDGFKSAINWVLTKWNDFHLTIGGGSFMGMSLPSFTLETPNIPLLASGGYIASGGAAIVGERGPEMVSLPTGATVHPNGSGTGNVFNIYEATNPQATAMQVSRRLIALGV